MRATSSVSVIKFCPGRTAARALKKSNIFIIKNKCVDDVWIVWIKLKGLWKKLRKGKWSHLPTRAAVCRNGYIISVIRGGNQIGIAPRNLNFPGNIGQRRV